MTEAKAVPVLRLWVSVLFGYLALGATLQVLPVFVPERFGGGAAASGLAVGIAFLATAVGRPFAGRFADAGRARPIVVIGGLLGALGGLGHLWAPNMTVLLVSRLLMGAGEAALFSGSLPWVLTSTPAERRGRVAGWFGLSMWGGLSAGPLLASAIGDFDDVWLVVVGLTVTSAILVSTTRGQDRPVGVPLLFKHWRDAVPRGAALPGLIFGMASFGYGTVAALLILHLQHDRIGAENYALAVFAVAFLLTRAAGSPAVDRFGGRAVARVSVAVEAVGLALIALSGNLTLTLVGVVLAAAGVAPMYPATVAITLTRAGTLRPGTSVGAVTSCWDLGILAAGPVGGLIAAGSAYSAAFIVAAVIALLSVVFIRVMGDAELAAVPQTAGQAADH